MSKIIRSILTAAILPVAGIFPLCAQQTAVLTDSPSGDASGAWGTTRAESYDVAVHVGMPQLDNASICRVAFPLETEEGIAEPRIWFSKELTLENKVNVPDIISVPAAFENGALVAVLESPVAIGKEGLYVGVSFTLDSNDTGEKKNPVSVVAAADDIFGAGFWVHTSRTYGKWKDVEADFGKLPLYSITLAGLPEHAVMMDAPSEQYVVCGEASMMDVVYRNYGTASVTTMGIALSGIEDTVASVHFDAPQGTFFGYPFEGAVGLPSVETPRTIGMTVSVAEVNGAPNCYSAEKEEMTLYACGFRPVNRPLFEEYTGTGCGYCPRGALAMERLKELYGDRFVAVAYHCDDIMSIAEVEDYPNFCPAQPNSYINRSVEADPWFGLDSELPFDIARVWEKEAAAFAPVEINLTCYWKEEAMERVGLKADFRFVRDYEDADFEMVYILAADGLNGSGRSWMQGNYYSGNDPAKWPSEFSVLIDAPNPMPDQVYDEVAVALPSRTGIAGSIPSSIARDRVMNHSFDIPLTEAVNLDGMSLVQDKGKLYAVAAILDRKENRILNAVRCDVPSEYSGIRELDGTEIVKTQWYDLQGRAIAGPEQGRPAIKVDVYSDGTSRVSKTL